MGSCDSNNKKHSCKVLGKSRENIEVDVDKPYNESVGENNRKRLRKETIVSRNQFGFMPGRWIMKPKFCVRKLVGNYREKKNNLVLGFYSLWKGI